MTTPRIISSEGQGTMTPHTARTVKGATVVENATPRLLDGNGTSPWAAIQESMDHEATLAQHAQERVEADRGEMREGVVGMLSERYTRDLEHWQQQSDLPERRMMVQRIIAMTRSKMLENATTNRLRADGQDRAPSLAKRIELSLYSRAASFDEYRDLNTLRRRLQSLVALSFHEAAASKRVASMRDTNSCLGKRKFDTKFGISKLHIKRQRNTANERSEGSFFIFSEDILREIFSFLSGIETVRCTGINRYTSKSVPKCVVSLDLELKQLKRGFDTSHGSLLSRYHNLQSLHVYNERRPCDVTDTGLPLHAWGCSEHDLSHDNIGEEVILALSECLEMGACRKLKQLRLVSVFNNTCRNNALHSLCAALRKGCCLELEHLLLGGNGISDVGTVDIAWLLRVGTLAKLTRLDIRRNYIGEAGVKRMMNALLIGRCRQLKYLCMGGNIITDNCVAPIVRVLSSSSCPQMRFLGLEDNFLSTQGVHVIIQAAIEGGMMPKLHHVASEAARSA